MGVRHTSRRPTEIVSPRVRAVMGLGAAALVICLLLAPTAGWSAPPPPVVVNSTAQEVPFATNGNCTLGEAVAAVNTRASVDQCTVTAETDTIALQPGTTYTLTKPDNARNGLPLIQSTMTITGGNAKIKRSTTKIFRFFEVAPNAQLTLVNVALETGNADTTGGAVFVNAYGHLVVKGGQFIANTAPIGGAISADWHATVAVTNSSFWQNSATSRGGAVRLMHGGDALDAFQFTLNTFFGNNSPAGAAIFVEPTSSGYFVQVADSLFSTNLGGAAVDNQGNLTVDHCTFSGNVGGAIRAGDIGMTNVFHGTFTGNGSATKYLPALAATGTAQIVNATFYNNPSVAIAVGSGKTYLTHDTISANGDTGLSIAQGATAMLAYTVIAGNAGKMAPDCMGAIVSKTPNLLGSDQGCTGLAAHDLKNIAPGLAPFSDSTTSAGGHLPLLAASPAIDQGTGLSCYPTDQLDHPRDAKCDLGAIEAVCGDGVIHAALGEMCDDGNFIAGDGCSKCVVESVMAAGPVCGNGTVEGTEGCDDGNTVDEDGCLNSCVLAVCGDGIVRKGVEQCDDGNASNQDACTQGCKIAFCSDGFVHTGSEQCDDGDMIDTNACFSCVAATCGDGVVWAGKEQCDDGNTAAGDGCSSTCQIEQAKAVCGNGILETGEFCDDGNTSNTDLCLNICSAPFCGDGFIGQYEQCDDGNGWNFDACLDTCVPARCGDGVVWTETELCDDGNTSPTDGCLPTCVSATCGDGFVWPGKEQCDDGNVLNTDGCTNACVQAVCGDGFVQIGVETCDDGNTADGDSCPGNCLAPSCGDGIVQAGAGEACDDGNTSNTDGCLTTCQSAVCGDGYLRAGTEACDDHNTKSGDGCRGDCQKVETCGDGVLDGAEACDDDNTAPGDGCSGVCTKEPPVSVPVGAQPTGENLPTPAALLPPPPEAGATNPPPTNPPEATKEGMSDGMKRDAAADDATSSPSSFGMTGGCSLVIP
ncbi:MAG: DUF4215 domain-containing protein [Deltaproteobacteria bacterium]|nr:DUF4215 domain-containing protein [Deltaproteobacteria bacterium]